MAKHKNDYFEMMVNQTKSCVEASELLETMILDFSPEKVDDIRAKIHEVEHKADSIRHDIISKLSIEFITPIDQEDILRLVQIIDDITDAIDEVAIDFYMYDIKVVPEKAAEFARLVNKCVNALLAAVTELKNFKKPAKLTNLLVDVFNIEGEADLVYTDAIHNIFSNNEDAKTLIGGKAIFQSLEDCCDLCEHASDVIEQIIIKNT